VRRPGWRPCIYLGKRYRFNRKVISRTSRIVPEFGGMPYEERLKSLDWCTLEER